MILKTERLTLEKLTSDSLANLIKLQSDPKVVEFSFMANGKPRPKQDIEKTLNTLIEHQKNYGYSLGSVHEIETKEFVGIAGIVHLKFDSTSHLNEIGYQLLPNFWGKGYASELSKNIIKWGFENFKFKEIVACTHLNNIASQKVLIKSGMIRGANIDYKGHIAAYYSIKNIE